MSYWKGQVEAGGGLLTEQFPWKSGRSRGMPGGGVAGDEGLKVGNTRDSLRSAAMQRKLEMGEKEGLGYQC